MYREEKLVGDWIKSYFVIPLLPANKVKEGWEYVGTMVEGVTEFVTAQKPELSNKPGIVHKYWKKFWIRQVGTDRVSVYKQYTRTNNSAESWHGKINKGVGPNPKMWDYCDKIVTECLCFVDNFRRYQAGVRITRQRPVTTTQIQIENATRKFELDGDVGKFIRRCRHLAGRKAKNVFDPESYAQQPVSQPPPPPAPLHLFPSQVLLKLASLLGEPVPAFKHRLHSRLLARLHSRLLAPLHSRLLARLHSRLLAPHAAKET